MRVLKSVCAISVVVCMELGYQNQYEGDWMLLHETEDAVMAGRAVTAQFMPLRPDLEDQIIEQGKKEGRMWRIHTIRNS